MKTSFLAGLPLALILALAGCDGQPAGESAQHEHAGEHEEHDEPPKGEHGGRLLEEGALAVELAIAEKKARRRSTRPGCTAMAGCCRPRPAASRCVSNASAGVPRITGWKPGPMAA
ncbi:hypothetical protein ACFS3C_03775 [Azotobacter vinelandii]